MAEPVLLSGGILLLAVGLFALLLAAAPWRGRVRSEAGLVVFLGPVPVLLSGRMWLTAPLALVALLVYLLLLLR